jgi:archaemetzincin
LIDGEEYQIVISPIGDIESTLSDLISSEVIRIFGLQTGILPLIDRVDFAFDPQRRQYYSTLILEKLAAAAPFRAVKVLGITTKDLFIPILTHVYGEAQLGGKTCIISTCRLDEENPKLRPGNPFHHRAVKEAIHELGHTFKLKHCPERNCVMHYCRSIADVDRKTDQLCRHCRVLLADEIRRLGMKEK